MTEKPFIHPASELLLQALSSNLPQSLLIYGPEGIGLGVISRYVATLVGAVPTVVLPEKDEKVDLEIGIIGVDIIRRLYKQTRTIHTDKQVIIIDYAERMGIQAQNAFLKLLEEPGASIYFILATHVKSKLLPTITSRMQSIELQKITQDQSNAFLDFYNVAHDQKRIQLLFMAEGLPAEMYRLLHDEKYFLERSQLVRDARELLQGSTYDRLKIAQAYKDDRQKVLVLLNDASSMLRRSILTKPEAGYIVSINKILFAYDQINANGNIRLCLSRLVL